MPVINMKEAPKCNCGLVTRPRKCKARGKGPSSIVRRIRPAMGRGVHYLLDLMICCCSFTVEELLLALLIMVIPWFKKNISYFLFFFSSSSILFKP